MPRFYERLREKKKEDEPPPEKHFQPIRIKPKPVRRRMVVLRGRAGRKKAPTGTRSVQEAVVNLKHETDMLAQSYHLTDPIDEGARVHVRAWRAYHQAKKTCEKNPEATTACSELNKAWDDFEAKKKELYGKCRCPR